MEGGSHTVVHCCSCARGTGRVGIAVSSHHPNIVQAAKEKLKLHNQRNIVLRAFRNRWILLAKMSEINKEDQVMLTTNDDKTPFDRPQLKMEVPGLLERFSTDCHGEAPLVSIASASQ